MGGSTTFVLSVTTAMSCTLKKFRLDKGDLEIHLSDFRGAKDSMENYTSATSFEAHVKICHKMRLNEFPKVL